ncbi:hypothetical protein CBS115989_10191 [Aspergillus niger]|nr:hypothetical protein CBS115989_10191 [Aspergillus niger]KAI2826160.1 hypothetical protein CBS133816_7814 [Aspergillus niger]KAI2857576.1 hypothetical protein CBS12448_6433 [Aspergillus niger]KAI2867546.1 hypothetical protein CBS13152_10849 [Aspergillus niger]KAI2886294.1 hypothetical protein CBS11852_7985 [Aspergillus niger]
MSQPMSEVSWPAGIPQIRLHLTDLDPEELAEEAKGWLLFVREESHPTSNTEDALRQRRALIETWATASQEFRESYHSRSVGYTSAVDYPAQVLSQLAPRPNKRFLCLAPINRKTHPRSYIHLVKFLILLYVHQDEWSRRHPFDLRGAGDAPRCHIPELLGCPPAATATTTLSEVLPALYLAPADYRAISMTRQGTVVFADGPDLTWFVIDAPGLATGRLTLVEYGSNGDVRVSTLRRPWNMGQTMTFEQVLGKDLDEIAESGIGGPPQYNEPLDMNLPILELLESTRLNNKFLFPGYGCRDLWVRIIEQSAPGYLELEAQGREVEFELDDLLVVDP